MRIRRRQIVTLVALLAAGGAIAVLWNYTPIVPRRVSELLTDNLLRERGYRLEMDAVRGTVHGEVLFLHPRLLSLADSSQVLLRADALRVRLRRPWSVLRGRVLLGTVRLERPRVLLPERIGMPGGAGAALPGGKFPRLAIDALEIVDASVRRAEPGGSRLVVDHLDAALQVRSRPTQLRIGLRQARALLPADSLRIDALRGDCTWRADTLRVEAASLGFGATALEGAGFVVPARRSGRWTGEVRSVDLEEVCRLLHLPPHRGKLAGPLGVTWGPQGLEATTKVSGVVDDVSLQDLALEVESQPGHWRVRRAQGTVNLTPLELQLDLDRRSGWLAGELAVQRADLRRLVPARFQPEELARAPDHELSGSLHFRRSSRGDSLDLDLALGKSSVQRVRLDRLTARLAVRGRWVGIEAVQIESPLGRAHVAGEIRGDTLDVDFEAEVPRVESVLAALGRTGPSGDLAAKGHLGGSLAAPAVEAELHSTRAEYGAATLWNVDLGLWGTELRPAPQLAVEVRSESLCVRGRVLRDLSADVAYADRVLHVLRSQAAAGDTVLAAAGSLGQSDRDWTGARRSTTRLRLETALVRLRDTEFRIEDPALFWWRGDAVHVDSLRLVTRGGSLVLDGTFDRLARTIAARADLEELDLGFVRELVQVRQQIAGTASGWVEARGSLDATRVDGHLEVHGGECNGLSFDSLTVGIRSEANGTRLHDVRLVTPHGALRGDLRLGLLPRLGRWLEPEGGKRALEESEQAEITGALDLVALDLARLYQARAPGAPAPSWEVRLSSAVRVAGTLAHPRIEMRGTADRIRLGGIALDAASFDAAYADEKLALASLDLNTGGQVLHADAQIPLRLHLLQGLAVFRDRPFQAEVILPHSSFALVERFLPLFEPPPVELPRGEIEGDVRVVGTLAAPEARGGFRVVGASFVLRDMEEVYREVYGTGEFEGTTLRIGGLRGLTGTKGSVQGQGLLRFANLRLADYDFQLQLDHVPVRSIPDISAIVTGDLEIRAARVDTVLVPDMHGTLDVLSGEIRQEFEPESGTAPTLETDVPDWLSDLTLRAEEGNVWIRNSLVEAELQGNVQVVRRRREYQVQGMVRVKRGTYSYLIHRFEITQGELDFSRNIGFDPRLDIEGRRGRPGDRTYVTLTGTASAPQLSFRSDRAGASSDMIQQELLSPMGQETQAAQNALANFAEQTLSDLALLSELRIDPAQREADKNTTTSALAAFSSYNVTAGREISNRVFLLYTQGVKSDLAQRVSIELDINRWLLLDSSYERRMPEASLNQSQNSYEVNLKYRYEY